MISVVNLLDVHVKLPHHVPVKCLEGHSIGVIAQLELLLGRDNFLKILIILFFLHLLELYPAAQLVILMIEAIISSSWLTTEQVLL